MFGPTIKGPTVVPHFATTPKSGHSPLTLAPDRLIPTPERAMTASINRKTSPNSAKTSSYWYIIAARGVPSELCYSSTQDV